MWIIVSGDLSFVLGRTVSPKQSRAAIKLGPHTPWVCMPVEEKDGWPQGKGPEQLISSMQSYQRCVSWQTGRSLMTVI